MRRLEYSDYSYGIDALRFIAFLFVFIHHFVYRGGNSLNSEVVAYWNISVIQSFAYFGLEGVNLFFFLSAFLISRLLLQELTLTNTINRKKFFARRILRIWPLYFLYVAFGFFGKNVLGNQSILLKEIPSLFSFTYNWYQLNTGESRGIAAILWSISVEEQIYLLLALSLIYAKRIKAMYIGAIFITISIIARIIIFNSGQPLSRNTFSYLGIVGAAIILADRKVLIYEWYSQLARGIKGLLPVIIFCYIYSYPSLIEKPIFEIVSFDMSALISLYLVVVMQIKDKKYNNESRIQPTIQAFAALGKRGYGLYIYHWPVLIFVVSRAWFYSPERGLNLFGVSVCLLVTVSVSFASYQFYELPFLRLKRYFTVKE